MRLILRTGNPSQPGEIVSRTDDFSEPFLPDVGDIVADIHGRDATVTARRFTFHAGAPTVEGVELFIS
jgi:hypothetical protein